MKQQVQPCLKLAVFTVTLTVTQVKCREVWYQVWCKHSWHRLPLALIQDVSFEATLEITFGLVCLQNMGWRGPTIQIAAEYNLGMLPHCECMHYAIYASFFMKSMHTHFSFPLSKKDSGALGCFSKLFCAWKAILETMIRLPWKAALLICFRYEERQNNCQVSKLEMCSYWRYCTKGFMSPE